MFTQGWADSSWGSEILMDDGDMVPLRVMLEFMYTGATKLEMPLALQVLSLANRFAIVALQNLAEIFIGGELDVNNCCALLTAADRFSCMRLRTSCFDFTVAHFEFVIGTDAFNVLSYNCFYDLICSNSLLVRSEEVVFNAVSSWIAYDQTSRICHASALLNKIRFPMMTSRFLFEVVEKNTIMLNLADFPEKLLAAYRFQAVSAAGLAATDWDQNMTERGREEIVFGSGAGRLCALSNSMSKTHPLDNVRSHDDK
uniref:BACK domain-containing protein n=2 Tax=Spongospora subterranea TaxID=70186 RepID=A0A0H5QIL1_9EUKA|eukprot:CRZ01915.1 hypothetical protein [Spongospora subterranea]